MKNAVFLQRVVLKNYKSIATCAVRLGPLMFLVGTNGAGKSNFMDALRLVAESLRGSLEQALRERGGINEVRRRSVGSAGRPTHFGIRLEFAVDEQRSGFYSFNVGAKPKGGYQVKREECRIGSTLLGNEDYYVIESGNVKESSEKIMPPGAEDRLYLVNASGLPAFRPLYDALSRMGFYNVNPDEMRDLQAPDMGEVLRRDGGNIASVLAAMNKGEAQQRMQDFLAEVVPGITKVTRKSVGKKETLEFQQRAGQGDATWHFPAENMSDGTLRALGVLTALFQKGANRGRIPLVGIEEPEMAVHPGAAGVLRDALRVASASTQVLVTSHSPDLLDDKTINPDAILGVANVNGETKIGAITDADRGAMRDQLFSAGELLKQGQLEPDIERIAAIPQTQLDLFGRLEP